MRHKSRQKEEKRNRIIIRRVFFSLLLMLVAAAIGFAAASYREYKKFKTYSERARNIYMAAMHALDAMSDDAFSAFANHFEQEISDDEQTVYFQVKGASDLDGRKLFEQLTEGYIYNADGLADAIGIELNLSDKTVVSVACADSKIMLTCDGSDGKNHINFKNKDSRQRQQKCIGYYDEAMYLKERGNVPAMGSVSIENGDVLEVVFELNGLVRERIGQVGYEINVRRAEDETVMKLTVNALKENHLLPAEDVSAQKTITVSCRFYGHQALDTEETMIFPAYIDSQYRAHLVLDALDLAAANGHGFDEASQSVYADSYSSMRFLDKAGLSVTDKISVGVRPVGAGDEAWAYSEEESLLMADSDDGYLTIENARHLFNLRFIEENTKTPVTYEQTASFAWGNADFGIVGAGHVFKNMMKQKTADFVPIEKLSEGSELTASKDSVIEGLTFSNTLRQDRF